MRSMRAVRCSPRTALTARNTKNMTTQNATGIPQYNMGRMICGPTVGASAKWYRGRVMRAMISMLLVGLCAVAAAKPPAGRSVDGRPLTLVGQGARVKDGDKLYDMQMWIDEEDGRRAFPALAMRA